MAEARADMPLIACPKEISDRATSSGTSAALHLLTALAQHTEELAYEERAKLLVGAASGQAQHDPIAFPGLLVALNRLRQEGTGPMQYAARGAIHLRAKVERDGNAAILILNLFMAPGWHANANQPLQDYLIPTSVRLVGDVSAWRIDNVSYPRLGIFKLGFQGEPLAVYHSHIGIRAALTPEPKRRDRLRSWLTVEVRLQACSHDPCLPPETRILQIPASAMRDISCKITFGGFP